MILWAKVWNDPFVGAEEPDELASTLKPTHAQPPVSRTELVAYLVYSIGVSFSPFENPVDTDFC